MYTLGIDIGSTTSKCVILRDGTEIVGTSVVAAGTGTDGPQLALKEGLADAGIREEELAYTIATGYGRKRFDRAQGEVSELSCHARGVHFVFPEVHTVIDIGGQDAKVLVLNEKGRMMNFVMNDKCAAGTGRFLDEMAAILKLDISDLETEAVKSKNPAAISSTCTVFAESEVISQLAAGTDRCDLVAGICQSVAVRAVSLARRAGVKEKVCMSGGVARNAGVRNAMEKELGVEIVYSDIAQLKGALGASLYAYDNIKSSQKKAQ